jgi:hypothetical protein
VFGVVDAGPAMVVSKCGGTGATRMMHPTRADVAAADMPAAVEC